MRVLVCYKIGLDNGTASIEAHAFLSIDGLTQKSLEEACRLLLKAAKDNKETAHMVTGNCVLTSVLPLEG